MRKLILFIFLISAYPFFLFSQSFEGSYTTGIFGGTPFWNRQNLEERLVNYDNDFYRFYNRLRAKGSIGDFSLKTSIIRSDLMKIGNGKVMFPNENVNETKLYQLYAEYDKDNLNVKAGRFTTLNRWYYNSVDGAYIGYDFTKNLSVAAYGGLDVVYSKDMLPHNEKDPIAYAEVAYREHVFGGKVKFMYLDEAYRTGFDFYGGFSKFRFSLNAGYDATNDILFDGSIGLYAYLAQNFNVSANVQRISPLEWGFARDHYLDRIQAAATYKLSSNYSLNIQQLVTSYNENLDYLTYFSLGHRHFFAGVNYIWGDSGNERFGISLGGNYNFMHNLKVSAGIASVDYLFNQDIIDDQHKQSYSTFLNVNYEPLEYLSLRGNISYYHQFESLPQKLRGGLAFQFKFHGGEK